MQRTLCGVVVLFLALILSGCIISKSPNETSVVLLRTAEQAFSVTVLPPGASYVWTLDGTTVTGQDGAYQYTATGGQHTLTVTATHFLGTDTQTWTILDAEATGSIGSEGGTVAVTDTTSPLAGAQTVIPAGSLASTVTITISQTTTPSGLSGHPVGPCVNFGPEGTEFTTPVDIYLPYADADDDGLVDETTVPEDQVKAGYFNETSGSWEEISVIDRDPAANRIHIQVSHFSRYIAYITYDPITLLYPLDSSTVSCSNVVEFSWEPGEFHSVILQYWISISEDSDPEDIPVLEEYIVGSSNTFTYYLEYGKRYIWKVVARENALEAPVAESVWRYFTMGPQDSDCDGISDVLEILLGTDPYDADSDEDGITDGQEDANQNGVVDIWENDPGNIDTDGDGIQDGTELGITLDQISPYTDTAIFQPDLDPTTTTSPIDSDTDNDNISDGVEDANHNGRVDAGENDPNVANQPPVAEAGHAQTIYAGNTVTLDGSGSTDPDNNISYYSWQQIGSPSVVLSDANAVNPYFVAPDVTSETTLTFELTVTDSGGLSSTDTCIITIQPNLTINLPPVANAGTDQSKHVDSLVVLDGSGSTDPENSIVSYQWQQIDGPTVTLTNADTAAAYFIVSVAVGSILTFELTVTDAGGLQATDTCVITISYAIDELLSNLVGIPGGTFQMGSTDNENGMAYYTTPVHTVTLSSFDIGAYEVTQAQFKEIMGSNPSYCHIPGYACFTENNPVENVTWYEAVEFCTKLSAQTGRTFTLPSEAQWEYACRAGSTTLYSFDDDDGLLDYYAWYGANSEEKTHSVGTKLPNPWGLYDMHGNVNEWCLDSPPYWPYDGAPTDGSAWVTEAGGYARIIRGGCWADAAYHCRSAYRTAMGCGGQYPAVGFRVIAVP